MKPELVSQGRVSTFGGPNDSGVSDKEGLALWERGEALLCDALFYVAALREGSGVARALRPSAYYVACRWDYRRHPRSVLRGKTAIVQSVRDPSKVVLATPVDWGPNEATGRAIDLSPGVAEKLGLRTDDEARVFLL